MASVFGMKFIISAHCFCFQTQRKLFLGSSDPIHIMSSCYCALLHILRLLKVSIFPSCSWSCQCPCGCGTVVKRYIYPREAEVQYSTNFENKITAVQVTRVVLEQRSGQAPAWTPPEHCPECNSVLIERKPFSGESEATIQV